MKNKILAIVTNTAFYESKNLPTGLWLGELTHFKDIVEENGYQLDIASPIGANVPIDPESLKFFVADKSIKQYGKDEAFLTQLNQSKSIAEIDVTHYDALYLTGGHGTMFDFVGNTTLNNLVTSFYEQGKVVSAVCHGVCGLLDVTLSNSKPLIDDKKITGYSWFEEILAFRKSVVPFNLEEKLIAQKAIYSKGTIPLTSYIQIDKKLITGQNPFSTKAVARAVVHELKKVND